MREGLLNLRSSTKDAFLLKGTMMRLGNILVRCDQQTVCADGIHLYEGRHTKISVNDCDGIHDLVSILIGWISHLSLFSTDHMYKQRNGIQYVQGGRVSVPLQEDEGILCDTTT